MKKTLIFTLIIILTFIIYLTSIDNKIYYVVLGDGLSVNNQLKEKKYSDYISDYLQKSNKLEKYITNYININNRITDVINDIKINKKINDSSNQTIKNVLIKADLLTISIGINDIVSSINVNNIQSKNNYTDLYKYIDQVSLDLSDLLSLIRQYCKEDIYLIGYYIPIELSKDEKMIQIFDYMNESFKLVCNENKVKFINNYVIFRENPIYYQNNSIYPSDLGNKAIANQVIAEINNDILKK